MPTLHSTHYSARLTLKVCPPTTIQHTQLLTRLDAVYFTGSDSLLGPLLAIVYKEQDSTSLSTVLIGRHGVSEATNMTISPKSRFYSACLNLPLDQASSLVRKALAISCLRTFSNMHLALKSYLTFCRPENHLFDWDETTAGTLASTMQPAYARFPADIGNTVLDSGILKPKFIKSTVIDIVYQNSPETNDINNALVYLFGHQLEHLFDPLAEYSPEHTEMLYTPPSYAPVERSSDNEVVRNVCQELFSIQSHFTTNLLNLLQDYLIPLRVKVLAGEIPGMDMRQLNVIFPPTIDEIVRVNNIFYEALALALPYGSYEMIKACGISIPYFYKACMRHEAATRNFSTNLRGCMDTIQKHAGFSNRFTINSIESIIHCSLHLTKIKLVLDRLVKSPTWREDERSNVKEFYQSAVGTIDSFGRESFISPYNNRIFTPTGKLLVEISKGWPKELEYGWINRRVVTIFDAIDVMYGEDDTCSIVFIFTDSIVIIRPTEPLSMTSESGIHKPSIADMLTHSMVNSVPLPNLPELDVVGWAPLEDVYMAEFGGPMDLAMYVTGGGLNTGSKATSHFKILKLVRPEVNANTIVNCISKAKIMNKTQPFHLFLNKQENLSTFASVYEQGDYNIEPRKCPIAVYINMEIPESVLESHELIACIGAQVCDLSHVAITVISKLAYNHQEIVRKELFSEMLSRQISRVYSLYFDSSNPFATEMIIQNNTNVANYLINVATTPKPVVAAKAHKQAAKAPQASPTQVQSPKLKHHPSLRQRVSSASSLMSRLTMRPSQDNMAKSPASATSKKRRSFPFMSSRDKSKPADKNYKTLSTISLPIESVTERPQEETVRFSYPGKLPPSTVTSPVPQLVQRTRSLTARSPSLQQQPRTPVPTYLSPHTLSPEQQQQIITRKASFTSAQSPIPVQHSRLPNMPSPDTSSIASSVAVKDSERFWDSVSASSVNLDPTNQSTPVKERTPYSVLETIESQSSGTLSSVGSIHVSRPSEIISVGCTREPKSVESLNIGEMSSGRGTQTSSLEGFNYNSNSTSSGLELEQGSSSANDSSSVPNWYKDLDERNRASSPYSLDTDLESGTDCTNETTYDDDDLENLELSLKNLTSFIDESSTATGRGKHLKLDSFHFPSKQLPLLPEVPALSNSDNSLLLSDDFAYLAGLVSPGEDPTAMARAESLYPNLRDSSLIFLGSYIHTRDDSECHFKRENSSSVEDGLARLASVQQQVPRRHAKLESIQSEEWQSMSESAVSSLAPFASGASSVSDHRSGANSIRRVNPPAPLSNTTTSNGSPSNASQPNLTPFTIPGHQSSRHHQHHYQHHGGPGVSAFSSLSSLSKFSSAELQLRSLTVTIDSLINEECAILMRSNSGPATTRRQQRVADLEVLNHTVMQLYTSTQNVPPIPTAVTALQVKDQARVVAVERSNRQTLMASLWPLVAAMDECEQPADAHQAHQQLERYRAVCTGFLDLEWSRRSTMREKLGSALPTKIWSV